MCIAADMLWLVYLVTVQKQNSFTVSNPKHRFNFFVKIMEIEKGHILPMLKTIQGWLRSRSTAHWPGFQNFPWFLRHDGFMSWCFFLSICTATEVQDPDTKYLDNSPTVRELVCVSKSVNSPNNSMQEKLPWNTLAAVSWHLSASFHTSLFPTFPLIFVFYTYILKPVVIHIISISIRHHTVTRLFKPRELFT